MPLLPRLTQIVTLHLTPFRRQTGLAAQPARWMVAALALWLSACASGPGTRPVSTVPIDAAAWQAVAGQPGLLYRQDLTLPGRALHWLRLDLRDPGLQLRLSPPDERGRTLDQFSGAAQALAAVNASFFSREFQPRGLTRSQGQDWTPVMAVDQSPLLDCNRRSECRLQLQPPHTLAPDSWLAVAGTPWLVRDGQARQPQDDATCANLCARTHPRTALGLDRSGRYLTLVLAEGRRGEVAGLSLSDLATLMVQAGVHQALNLDGGGSSSLLLQGRPVMQRPFNEPSLRPLANALLIQWAPAPDPPTLPARPQDTAP